jgi:serpin B
MEFPRLPHLLAKTGKIPRDSKKTLNMKRITTIHPPQSEMKPLGHHSRKQSLLLTFLLAIVLLFPRPAQACELTATSQGAALQTVTDAGNKFGFELYRQLSKNQKNQFFSPFSVFAALAMTSEGLGGASLETLRKAMFLPDEATLHAGLQELSKALAVPDAPYALAVANAIWPGASVRMHQAFLSTIRTIYLGESKALDYGKDPDAARKLINAWVEKQTRDRIKDLLPDGSITRATAMVLTNAIYFKGKWKLEFDKAATQDASFFLDGKSEVKVPLMHQPAGETKFSYGEVNGTQVLELPYKGDDLSMVVMLPKLGKIGDLEAGLDADKWTTLRNSMRREEVNIWLPRFKMEIGGSIREQLTAMGMGSLFGASDFSRMFENGAGGFQVSDVFHKAFVEVNEEGTEAAAATAVVVNETSALIHEPVVYDFRADHPFLFVIQHRATGNVLFMGKVMNPAA